jgi:hypothetical protein
MRCSVSLSSNSELIPQNSALLRVAERVGIRSRARRNCTRSYRGGQPPRKLPTRGTHPPRSPLFESHPRGFHALPHSCPLRFTPHVSRLQLAERVGFEPTVPLLGRMLSKHVDSTTLAPLRADFARRHLNTRSNGQQGEGRCSSPDVRASGSPLSCRKELNPHLFLSTFIPILLPRPVAE